MITPDDLVRREVHYCVSSLVSTLANGANEAPLPLKSGIGDLCDQAVELAAPLPDYEEAAREAGWEIVNGAPWHIKDNMMFGGPERDGKPDWQALCEEHDIEPYDREVYEHWIVSDWLAEKLAAKGEKVDTDFAGMTVWARTITGQGIAADSVIIKITEDLNHA